MSDATLTTEPRTASGTSAAGRLRREGKVPAVVYGLGTDTMPVAVSARELQHILSGGANTLITLQIDGADQLAMARQVQRHPVKGSLVHVDFVRVRADQTITAEVTLHLQGEAAGVKLGGMLEQMLFSVTVEAKPGDIPGAIAHDVSGLDMNDQLHVRELQVPAGVVIVNDPDDLVAQVSVPRGAEAAEGEEGEAVEGEAVAEGAGDSAGDEESGGGE